jgi:hypothetical protein
VELRGGGTTKALAQNEGAYKNFWDMLFMLPSEKPLERSMLQHRPPPIQNGGVMINSKD